MKVLVVGGSGMLGIDVCAELVSRGHEVTAPSSAELDITDPLSVATILENRREFDWCINCAAYTAVDKAETETREATELNAMGPGYLATACKMGGVKLIHVSTDFVFDGEATVPYTEDSRPQPIGVYGNTKRDGELAVMSANSNALIVRTSWLFGPNGRNFPKTMIGAWLAEKSLRVVSDQTGCPTYTLDLARVLVDLIEVNGYPGIYHACGPTATTWYQFAVEAITAYRDFHGIDRPVEITPVPTEEYPTPAKRPKYSAMSTAKLDTLGIQPMRPLSEELGDFVGRIE